MTDVDDDGTYSLGRGDGETARAKYASTPELKSGDSRARRGRSRLQRLGRRSCDKGKQRRETLRSGHVQKQGQGARDVPAAHRGTQEGGDERQ